jgi:hypothetical protein
MSAMGPPPVSVKRFPTGNVVVCVESELLTEALQQSDCLGSPAPAQPVPGESGAQMAPPEVPDTATIR